MGSWITPTYDDLGKGPGQALRMGLLEMKKRQRESNLEAQIRVAWAEYHPCKSYTLDTSNAD